MNKWKVAPVNGCRFKEKLLLVGVRAVISFGILAVSLSNR